MTDWMQAFVAIVWPILFLLVNSSEQRKASPADPTMVGFAMFVLTAMLLCFTWGMVKACQLAGMFGGA